MSEMTRRDRYICAALSGLAHPLSTGDEEAASYAVKIADAALAAARDESGDDHTVEHLQEMLDEATEREKALRDELDAAQRTINHLSPSCAALLARAEKAEAEIARLKQPLTNEEAASLIDNHGGTTAGWLWRDEAITAVKQGRA